MYFLIIISLSGLSASLIVDSGFTVFLKVNSILNLA